MFTVPEQIKDFDFSRGEASGGNLVLAGGHLVVATADRLIVFAAQQAGRE
jgi:hypothetical protein